LTFVDLMLLARHAKYNQTTFLAIFKIFAEFFVGYYQREP